MTPTQHLHAAIVQNDATAALNAVRSGARLDEAPEGQTTLDVLMSHPVTLMSLNQRSDLGEKWRAVLGTLLAHPATNVPVACGAVSRMVTSHAALAPLADHPQADPLVQGAAQGVGLANRTILSSPWWLDVTKSLSSQEAASLAQRMSAANAQGQSMATTLQALLHVPGGASMILARSQDHIPVRYVPTFAPGKDNNHDQDMQRVASLSDNVPPPTAAWQHNTSDDDISATLASQLPALSRQRIEQHRAAHHPTKDREVEWDVSRTPSR